MPNQTELAQLARQLSSAYVTKVPVAPPIANFPDLSVSDAYQVQLNQINARLEDGQTIRGYKVGLTSKAMQDQLGVSQPDFGHLLSDMFFDDEAVIAAANYLQPKIEPEIAFVMGAPLGGPGVDAKQAEAAIGFVVPALELIDSRVANWQITIADTICDNASSAGVILGRQRTALADVDLAEVAAQLFVGQDGVLPDQPTACGMGADVLGSPVNALVWLANTLGARGVSFLPGDVIMPGSLTPSFPVHVGTTATAEFSGLGSVSAVFR